MNAVITDFAAAQPFYNVFDPQARVALDLGAIQQAWTQLLISGEQPDVDFGRVAWRICEIHVGAPLQHIGLASVADAFAAGVFNHARGSHRVDLHERKAWVD